MMDWIQTFSGRIFRPRDPRPGDFDVRDIAHSLSLQCRYNGHCDRFYSVAEHSVRVSAICPPESALWGLLHDLGEAYLGDMPRPVKASFPEFEAAEETLLRTACQAFGLSWPMPPEVKRADDILLATEVRDLMAPSPRPWNLKEQPLSEPIVPLSPDRAEDAFLKRFQELSSSS